MNNIDWQKNLRGVTGMGNQTGNGNPIKLDPPVVSRVGTGSTSVPQDAKPIGYNPPKMPSMGSQTGWGQQSGWGKAIDPSKNAPKFNKQQPATQQTAGGPVPTPSPQVPQAPAAGAPVGMPQWNQQADQQWQQGRQQNYNTWQKKLKDLQADTSFVDPGQDNPDWMYGFDPNDDVTANGDWMNEDERANNANLYSATEGLPDWAYGEAQHWDPMFQEAFADAWARGNEVEWQRVRNLARAANEERVIAEQQQNWQNQWQQYNNTLPQAPMPEPVYQDTRPPVAAPVVAPPVAAPVVAQSLYNPWLYPDSSYY